jgi:CheY-like chemotaxis protein/transcriptional regulator with XRE-family HTH domain
MNDETPERTKHGLPPSQADSGESTQSGNNRFRAAELDRHIGERLRFVRRLSGLSQLRVASEIGLSYQQVQKYEAGANRVPAVLLAEYSGLFDLPMDWFIGPYNTCMDCERSCGTSVYGDIMHHLFRVLRDRSDQECDAVLGVVCVIAKLGQGLPESRLARLRRLLRSNTPESNAFLLEVVRRLADGHPNSAVPRGNVPEAMETTGQTSDDERQNILLVDDDPDILRMVSASLRAAGFSVAGVSNGDEALTILVSQVRVDAILTDYAMVGMDGIELLARAVQIRPGLPGIIITGYADSGRLGDLPPRIEVLSKPFRRMELVGRLRILLEGQVENVLPMAI